MTGLRKSPSTEAAWSPYPPPAETNNLWCDGPGRWKDEEMKRERATRRKMGRLGRENGRHLREGRGTMWGYGRSECRVGENEGGKDLETVGRAQ